ncbi:hypothetical protein RB614_30735 [Phytohabitans sp. ZYX-F-186]|uniref:Transposase IS701-like DDE domain-containing protein n=1 Tax=Phytohabitans maris TaxID=3071409 RepID=A0ABU0ZQ85_9ACTN|nr:hypothetical protein [Phytohabitans sp. ZYX-F-186]MDQ7908916.1 hypothetical protein [Phytohabitans sp. ZYX-F-186]
MCGQRGRNAQLSTWLAASVQRGERVLRHELDGPPVPAQRAPLADVGVADSVCPWKISAIVAAALVILHVEHDRTT